MVRINVLFFGALVEATGVNTTELYFNNTIPVETLNKKILLDFPVLKKYTFNIAINQQIARKKQLINDEDQIALLPPFAGG